MENKFDIKCLFNSFCVNPKIKFDTQTEDESIVLLLRAHPVTLLPCIFNSIMIIVLSIFFTLVFTYFIQIRQIFFFNIISIAFTISYVWLNFLQWYFNAGIVTTERVIDVDYSYITYKETTQARLGRIEDVTIKSSGYIGSLFNYGNVFIQTAGEEKNIEFFNVPKPSEVVRVINELLEKNGR